MKCRSCGTEIQFAINTKTGNNIPLVPFDTDYNDKTPRYSINRRSDGKMECTHDPDGTWMSHYANCTNPGGHSKKRKGEGR